MPPRILLATTCRWFSTARQALAIHQAGGTVDIVCPSGHPAILANVVQQAYPCREWTPLRDLRMAALASRPDRIIPCDDLTARHLHRLYERTLPSSDDDARFILNLLETSLGNPDGYPITESRDKFMSMVRRLGIRTPETMTVPSIADVENWLSKFGLPAVLKAEGTSGGEGVKIVRTVDEALRAYRVLHNPVAAIITAKRAVLDRDWKDVAPWLARRKRVVSIQAFVDGPDANIAAACWRGEILSQVSVEVLETTRPTGPATVVRLFENEEMSRAAEKIVGETEYSGLCGFDFILEKSTGKPYLIEMNARATQTCSLPLDLQRSPTAAICVQAGSAPRTTTAIDPQTSTIALFPGAWRGHVQSPAFQAAYHDIPREAPELVRYGMKESQNLSRGKWVRLFTKLRLYSS